MTKKLKATDYENEEKATQSESYLEKSDTSYRPPRRFCAAKKQRDLQFPKREENVL